MTLNDNRHALAPHAPESTYQARCESFGAQRDTYNRRSYRNANLSLILIIATLAALGTWLWQGDWRLLVLGALLGAGFLVSFIVHGRVDRIHAYYTALWEINQEGLQRLRRDWTKLPLRQPQPTANQPHAEPITATERIIANDLDLLGHASLQHLLSTASSPIGQATLQHWLLHPATPSIARRRQAASSALAPLTDLRDELALRGRQMATAQANYERFLAWAESEPWLVQRPWLSWIARLLPLAILGLVAAQLWGLTE